MVVIISAARRTEATLGPREPISAKPQHTAAQIALVAMIGGAGSSSSSSGFPLKSSMRRAKPGKASAEWWPAPKGRQKLAAPAVMPVAQPNATGRKLAVANALQVLAADEAGAAGDEDAGRHG
jgi:hypothetical protein